MPAVPRRWSHAEIRHMLPIHDRTSACKWLKLNDIAPHLFWHATCS